MPTEGNKTSRINGEELTKKKKKIIIIIHENDDSYLISSVRIKKKYTIINQ